MRQHEVVVIGAGPSAAGAVRSLKSQGIGDIVVLERERAAGGVPRHCGHTGYGLGEFGRLMTGPDYARRLADLMGSVDLRQGHTVRSLGAGGRLSVIGPEGGYEIAARTVLLAMGARETPRAMRLIGGVNAAGVLTTGALQQWVYLEGRRPAGRVVVVGTELVAFSTLLTCRHGGIEIAALIDSAPRTTARWPAGAVARGLFGVPVILGATLVEILGHERVEGVRLQTAEGMETIACDGVVFTGRFVPETALLKPGPIVLDTGSGGPEIDEYWRTSDPAYFAAGNLVHPIETAGRCFRDGLAAGIAIAKALNGALPPPLPGRRLVAGGALKYLYPQRLTGYGPAAPEACASIETRGALTIRRDGREVWSRRVHVLPERRIRLPAVPFAGDFTVAEVILS